MYKYFNQKRQHLSAMEKTPLLQKLDLSDFKINELPTPVLLNIAHYLSLQELSSFCRLNKKIFDFTKKNSYLYWQNTIFIQLILNLARNYKVNRDLIADFLNSPEFESIEQQFKQKSLSINYALKEAIKRCPKDTETVAAEIKFAGKFLEFITKLSKDISSPTFDLKPLLIKSKEHFFVKKATEVVQIKLTQNRQRYQSTLPFSQKALLFTSALLLTCLLGAAFGFFYVLNKIFQGDFNLPNYLILAVCGLSSTISCGGLMAIFVIPKANNRAFNRNVNFFSNEDKKSQNN